MNIFRASKAENVECENQAKFVQERILTTEERLSSLCNAFGTYLQKSCSLRDASDNIASTLYKFGTTETINKTLKCNTVKFAELLATIGDLRNHNIAHIEDNVVKQFLQYNTLCRNAKTEVRNIYNVQEIELRRRRLLGKVRQKDPHNRKNILKAECDLSKAAAETSQIQRALEEHIEIFEKKKITDLKSILVEFVTAEIRFHAEVIEFYTKAYQTLMDINVENDFQEILRQSPVTSRLEVVKKNMESTSKGNLSPTRLLSSNTSEESFMSKTSSQLNLDVDEESESSDEYTSEQSTNASESEESQVLNQKT